MWADEWIRPVGASANPLRWQRQHSEPQDDAIKMQFIKSHPPSSQYQVRKGAEEDKDGIRPWIMWSRREDKRGKWSTTTVGLLRPKIGTYKRNIGWAEGGYHVMEEGEGHTEETKQISDYRKRKSHIWNIARNNFVNRIWIRPECEAECHVILLNSIFFPFCSNNLFNLQLSTFYVIFEFILINVPILRLQLYSHFAILVT